MNGYRLLGINHMEVVSVLKELPIHVRMVCGRNIASQDPLCPIDTAQHQAAFQTRVRISNIFQKKREKRKKNNNPISDILLTIGA